MMYVVVGVDAGSVIEHVVYVYRVIAFFGRNGALVHMRYLLLHCEELLLRFELLQFLLFLKLQGG